MVVKYHLRVVLLRRYFPHTALDQGPMAEADHIAKTMRFLASDDAAHVQSAEIFVDGRSDGIACRRRRSIARKRKLHFGRQLKPAGAFASRYSGGLRWPISIC